MIRKIFIALLFCLPVFILVPHLDAFIFQPGSQYSDMAVSHYPNGIFLQNSIREQGVIPAWSDTILSGYPFTANPLSGLHYPPGWLALVMPLPFGYHLTLILHLLFGGIGMYLLLRKEGVNQEGAILGALVFEALPKVYAHLGAGHLTILYAFCWTPWLLFVEGHTWQRKIMGYLVPGSVLGIIALADIRYAAYAGILWIAFSIRNLLVRLRQNANHSRPMRGALIEWGGLCVINILFAGLAAAPLLLPLLEYIGLSTRAHLTARDNSVLSLPPAQLIGLVYPNIGGPAEWTVYSGAAVFLLAIYGFVMPAARKRAGFWLGIILLSLFLSLGSNIPFLENVLGLPGFNLLRVPPRALFLSGFGFSMVAAFALQSLLLTLEGQELAGKDPTNLVIFGLAAFFALLAVAVWLVVRQPLARIQFTWGAVFLLLCAVLIFLARKQRINKTGLVILLTSACLIDLLGVNGLSLVFTPVDDVIGQGKAAADFISRQPNVPGYRIYSPSYSLPQQTAVMNRLELADGVDPMQLEAYATFMQGATGGPGDGYSVTLPPFSNGDPRVDNRHYNPDAQLLGLLSVKYIVAEFPLEDSQLTLLTQFGETRVYANPYALPRAWVQMPGEVLGESISPVGNWVITPIEIRVQAMGPGLVVLSELFYPGWEVRIDQAPGKVIAVDGLLRGVEIAAGEHSLVFTYHPRLFYLGWVFFTLAWISVILVSLRGRKANA